MIFTPHKITIEFTHLSIITKEEIQFELTVASEDYLEVGNSHILCNEAVYRVVGNRQDRIKATLAIREKNDAATETSNNNENGKWHYAPIGIATFFPTSTHFKEGLLHYEISIPPDNYRLLRQAIIHSKTVEHICIDFDENVELGWEPDGSHQIWQPKFSGDDISVSTNILKISYSLNMN